MSFKTPILLTIFNRPQNTEKVFEEIKKIKPTKFYIFSDGHRSQIKGEGKLVEKARNIINKVNWNCNVKTFFNNKNLGIKLANINAIDWFFTHEENGIILEDDNIAHADFFYFCENLLERYSTNDEIFAISGSNFQNKKWRGNGSYYFSKYFHSWGWATWRRAWNLNDSDIKFWPNWKRSNSWLNFIPDKIERTYWEDKFDKVYSKQFNNSWAYPWMANIWYNNGLVAIPNVNLSKNIGFGIDATNTTQKDDPLANQDIKNLKQIKHPEFIVKNNDAEIFYFDNYCKGRYQRFPYNLIVLFKKIVSPSFQFIKKFLKIIN